MLPNSLRGYILVNQGLKEPKRHVEIRVGGSLIRRCAELHVAAVLERTRHRHFVGEFEVAAYRNAHGDASDSGPKRL